MKKLFVLLLIPGFLMAKNGDSSANKDFKPGGIVHVRGVVRLVGNEPFTRLVITASNGMSFYLPDDIKKKRPVNIGKTVRAMGVFFIKKLESADHKHQWSEAHLSNVTIQTEASNI